MSSKKLNILFTLILHISQLNSTQLKPTQTILYFISYHYLTVRTEGFY